MVSIVEGPSGAAVLIRARLGHSFNTSDSFKRRLCRSHHGARYPVEKSSAAHPLRGSRRSASMYAQVLYRFYSKQSPTSFQDLASATRFQKMVETVMCPTAVEAMSSPVCRR